MSTAKKQIECGHQKNSKRTQKFTKIEKPKHRKPAFFFFILFPLHFLLFFFLFDQHEPQKATQNANAVNKRNVITRNTIKLLFFSFIFPSFFFLFFVFCFVFMNAPWRYQCNQKCRHRQNTEDPGGGAFALLLEQAGQGIAVTVAAVTVSEHRGEWRRGGGVTGREVRV